jgi:chromate reductase
MKKKTIGVFVGSLRAGSFTRSVAKYLMKIAPDDYELKLFEIGQLPLYNQDLDENPPEAWVKFRNDIKPLDGFLFVTPEHNRSFPAALKNALDVASRPYGSSVWNGKPGAVVSVSPGALGGFGANHHLRQVLAFLNVPTMQQPEAYVGSVMASLDEKGEVVASGLQDFLKQYMDAFVQWINRFAG